MSASSHHRWWGVCVLLAVFATQAGNAPLDELEKLMPQLQPEVRADLQRRAGQWQGWNAAQREAFQQRMEAWDALTRVERAVARERYLAWRVLPTPERADVTAVASHYQKLSAEQQKALRDRFDALDGSERRGWLLGPVLGEDYPALQPLLAQVPAEEHAPLLRVLRAMTPSQRRDLAVLVKRSPPQDRAQMRSELAALERGGISAWLWERLDR